MTFNPRNNPTRRNRNIGTAKQGHGHNNHATVPRRWKESVYDWNRTPGSRIVNRIVWGRDMPILVEPTRRKSWHACTVDDVAHMLNLLPEQHVNTYKEIEGIRGVVLRQSTRKEASLIGAWGRICFSANGPIIQLTATAPPLHLRWGRHLKPDDEEELARIQSAATTRTFDGRHHRMTFDLDAVRRVQLFHTLPHEIGHWVDMLERVEIPTVDASHETWKATWDRYWQRPDDERELFANRYASAAIERLRNEGRAPFARIIDIDPLSSDGLDPNDFIDTDHPTQPF